MQVTHDKKIYDSLWLPRPLCADPGLKRWLLDRGSLTQRIHARCDRFHVVLHSQRASTLRYEERVPVGAHRPRRCLVREVSLNCGATPVVFAHSVVGPRGLDGPWRMLRSLGTRPLGAALFADPLVERCKLRYRKLRSGHALYRDACGLLDDPPAFLWARRSLFVLRRSRLLVTEVFLPSILALDS